MQTSKHSQEGTVREEPNNNRILLVSFNILGPKNCVTSGCIVNLREPAKYHASFTISDSFVNEDASSRPKGDLTNLNHSVLSRKAANELVVESVLPESQEQNVVICYSNEEDLQTVKNLICSQESPDTVVAKLDRIKVCDLREVLLDNSRELQCFISLFNCFCNDDSSKCFLANSNSTKMQENYMKRIEATIIQQAKPPATPIKPKRKFKFNERVFQQEFSSCSKAMFQDPSSLPSFDKENNVFLLTTLQPENESSTHQPKQKYTWKRPSFSSSEGLSENSGTIDQDFFENMKTRRDEVLQL